MELAHQRAEFSTPRRESLQFQYRYLASLISLPSQGRIGERHLLRRHIVNQGQRADEPEFGRYFLWVGKAWRQLVQVCAEHGKRLRGRAHCGGHLRIDALDVAKVRAERDTQATHPGGEILAVV